VLGTDSEPRRTGFRTPLLASRGGSSKSARPWPAASLPQTCTARPWWSARSALLEYMARVSAATAHRCAPVGWSSRVRMAARRDSGRKRVPVRRCRRPSRSRHGARHLPAHPRGRPGELCWPHMLAAEHDLPDSSQYGDSSHPQCRM